MNKEQESPSKLKTTQTILQSLYEKIMRPTTDSPQADLKASTCSNYQRRKSEINNYEQKSSYFNDNSPTPQKQRFLTEPNQYIFKDKRVSHIQKSPNIQSHTHSQDCCIYRSINLVQKLKKASKNQYLLQTYQQQVEYLKKLAFLQSQQIEKLRRMLRNQQNRRSHEKQQMLKSKPQAAQKIKQKNRQGIQSSKIQTKTNTEKLKAAKQARKGSLIKQQKGQKSKKKYNQS